MTGYQEVVTDPSFAEQLVCFTAPMVGNYGVAAARDESRRPHARAVVMREARGPAWTDWLHERGIVALSGIDTRSLVLHLRERGAMRAAAVAGASDARGGARGRPADSRRWRAARSSRASRPREPYVHSEDGDVDVAVVDYGVKRSILRRLAAAGAQRDRLPARRRRRHARRPRRGVLLANGPGDPEPLAGRGRDRARPARPDAGLRHLPRPPAARARDRRRTFKLPFGHRGANHPGPGPPQRQGARDDAEPRLRGRGGGGPAR